MNAMRMLALLAVWAAALAAPALAQPVRTANVEAELHSARAAIAPGETFTVVLRQTLREGWHTYWLNPGDAGEPTTIAWRLPRGAAAGPIQWPTPHAIPFATLVNYGYSDEVLLPVTISAPASLGPGQSFVVSAEASWVVCSDICVFEEGALQLRVPVAARGRDHPVWGPRIEQALAALPREGGQARISAGSPARLSLALADAESGRNFRFFPVSRDAMAAAAPQSPRVGEAGVSFSLTPGVAGALGNAPLEGVVAYEAPTAAGWTLRGVRMIAEPGAALPGTDARAADFSDDYALRELESGATSAAADGASIGLWAAIFFAFIGGVILNVMPCVLPVLSVKALAFAGGVQAGQARRHGALYFAGVMLSFLSLAGLLIALRGAGEAVGWGFQLQAPWVNAALALLFFAIGLNLLGVFDVGGAMQNVGAGLAGRSGDAGAFFTGALAVVAATPCTAPFMAGAIGVAMTQSAGATLLVFAALGLGFALPLTALHFAPALQRLAPKPGPWMERARNVLAFPMFAAAIWLAWVLAQQSGPGGVTALLGIAAALAFVFMTARWGRVWLAVGLLALAVATAVLWRPLIGAETQPALAAEPWSPQRVAELRAEGRPVFVNFTAAWCVTCKVNEGAALASPRVARAFAEAGMTYLRADWTNRDPAIAAALAAHGRAGVPLYLYYPPGGEAAILPQLLSEELMLEIAAGGAP